VSILRTEIIILRCSGLSACISSKDESCVGSSNGVFGSVSFDWFSFKRARGPSATAVSLDARGPIKAVIKISGNHADICPVQIECVIDSCFIVDADGFEYVLGREY